jgi:hypothetical protein
MFRLIEDHPSFFSMVNVAEMPDPECFDINARHHFNTPFSRLPKDSYSPPIQRLNYAIDYPPVPDEQYSIFL